LTANQRKSVLPREDAPEFAIQMPAFVEGPALDHIPEIRIRNGLAIMPRKIRCKTDFGPVKPRDEVGNSLSLQLLAAV
jgi:hypothetical protein